MNAYNNDIIIKQAQVANIVCNRIEQKACQLVSTKIEIGFPEWFINVINLFYENLPQGERDTWYLMVLVRIKPGCDLNQVEAPLVIFILESLDVNYDTEAYPEVKKSIQTCIELYKIGDLAPSQAWSAAASAARSAAASAARSASESAARSASESAAWSAARSASESAARSASESAAWSASESAAWSAARSAAYKKYAERLLVIIGGL